LPEDQIEELPDLEYSFDCLQQLKITFTDSRIRKYLADSYSVNALMVHLYRDKVLVRMIPYMMIREIEVSPKAVRALLTGKNDVIGSEQVG